MEGNGQDSAGSVVGPRQLFLPEEVSKHLPGEGGKSGDHGSYQRRSRQLGGGDVESALFPSERGSVLVDLAGV